MDKITARAVARAKLETFLSLADERPAEAIKKVLKDWNALAKHEGFDEFVGAISVVGRNIEKGQEKMVANTIGAQCESFLLKVEQTSYITPRHVGGGRTGVKQTPR